MLRSENPPITSCCLLFAFCVFLTEFNQYCQSPWTLWLGRNRTSARFGNECDDFFFYLLMLCVPVFLPPHPPPRCRRAHVVRSPSRAPHTSVQCVCMCVCVFCSGLPQAIENVLVLGDGDFSFSMGLVRHCQRLCANAGSRCRMPRILSTSFDR